MVGSKVPDKTIFFQSCLGVFQGGGCRAAAFAGAYEVAVGRGVHFAGVAGTSAGSIVAALIGAGATPSQVRETLEELDFKMFTREEAKRISTSGLSRPLRTLLHVVPVRKYRHMLLREGVYSGASIEDWLDKKLRSLLKIANQRVRFKDLVLPTWVVATDLVARSVRVWSSQSDPEQDVARAVRASCSIPLFFQPVDGRYVDGGALSNLPAFVFPSTGSRLARRILAFALESDTEGREAQNAFDLMGALASAVVDGTQTLQLQIQADVHIITIPTGSIKATDFELMTQPAIQDLLVRGREAAADFFKNELARVHVPPPPDVICGGEDEFFTWIVEQLDAGVKEVLIAEEDADWIFSLFPAFLFWRRRSIPIKVILPQIQAAPQTDEQYKRRLLRALGLHVCEVPAVPTRAFIFNPSEPEAATALVRIHRGGVEATRYAGWFHSKAIEALRDQIAMLCPHSAPASQPPVVRSHDQAELLSGLQGVTQYSGSSVRLTVEAVPLANLFSLTTQVREFKYRQAGRFVDLYAEAGVTLFEPALVELEEGKTSIITPPVVEQSGNNFILIQGSTRSVLCRDRGIEQITCVVARGVGEPLPSETTLPLSRVGLIGTSVSPQARYEGLNYALFRDIERRMHPNSGLL